jgi:hypothetical protein
MKVKGKNSRAHSSLPESIPNFILHTVLNTISEPQIVILTSLGRATACVSLHR